MSRRVEKKLTQNETVTKHERFVYDNYKCIEKLDVLNGSVASQKYAWRGDELLCMSDANGTYAYFSDANKNIGQLINIATGTICSKYEYSPYGQLTSSDDALSNPFRFSSEYHDEETGLIYYNYRYYSLNLGRWLSRDPIGERGSLSLYCMLRNDPINQRDYLGLAKGFWNELIEKVGGAWEVGPYDAWRAGKGEIAEKAIDESKRIAEENVIKDPCETDTEYKKRLEEHINALRHAIWQGLLTKEFGADSAKNIGDYHELGERINDDFMADKQNNYKGREIGKNAKSDEDIINNVTQAYKEGSLNTGQYNSKLPHDGPHNEY